jgi:hypothetical protein
MRSYDKLFFNKKTLFRINQHADDNQMSIQNLAIVFGPTLFGQAPVVGQQNGGVIADTPFQNLVSELLHVQHKLIANRRWRLFLHTTPISLSMNLTLE